MAFFFFPLLQWYCSSENLVLMSESTVATLVNKHSVWPCYIFFAHVDLPVVNTDMLFVYLYYRKPYIFMNVLERVSQLGSMHSKSVCVCARLSACLCGRCSHVSSSHIHIVIDSANSLALVESVWSFQIRLGEWPGMQCFLTKQSSFLNIYRKMVYSLAESSIEVCEVSWQRMIEILWVCLWVSMTNRLLESQQNRFWEGGRIFCVD